MPRSVPAIPPNAASGRVWEAYCSLHERSKVLISAFCGRVEVCYTECGLLPYSRTLPKDHINLRVWEMKI